MRAVKWSSNAKRHTHTHAHHVHTHTRTHTHSTVEGMREISVLGAALGVSKDPKDFSNFLRFTFLLGKVVHSLNILIFFTTNDNTCHSSFQFDVFLSHRVANDLRNLYYCIVFLYFLVFLLFCFDVSTKAGQAE